MSKNNCVITRNFAFGKTQYKKGPAFLSGGAEDFAVENNLATDWIAAPSKPVKKAKKETKHVTI